MLTAGQVLSGAREEATAAGVTTVGEVCDLGTSRAALLEAGLRLEPEQVILLQRAGEAELASGRPDRARAYLERALAVAPGHAPSRRALIRARRMLGGASGGAERSDG